MKLVFFIALFLSSCYANDIEIKGLKMGMKYDDISKLYTISKFEKSYFATMKDGKDITIGGVKTNFVGLGFSNETLDSLMISFESTSFEDVLDAIKTKYSVKCEYSKIQNRMGAIFNQIECNYDDGKSSMFIKKHAKSNVDSSFIGIRSKTKDMQLIKQKESSKKDI